MDRESIINYYANTEEEIDSEEVIGTYSNIIPMAHPNTWHKSYAEDVYNDQKDTKPNIVMELACYLYGYRGEERLQRIKEFFSIESNKEEWTRITRIVGTVNGIPE